MSTINSFNTKKYLELNNKKYTVYDASSIEGSQSLPFSLKILLENLLRNEDDVTVSKQDINTLLAYSPDQQYEIAYRPARVLMQDFTGVPAIVDLAAMRSAMADLNKDPDKINPLQAAEMVIDHSVQVDQFGSSNSLDLNTQLEFSRNKERYHFLKWGQSAFSNLKIIPPGAGIVHQVNLEYLARVVFTRETAGETVAFPDTLVGTDSHTTMINGLGILGWGVGGIEAEASMLGQPISMLIPKVVGFRLDNDLVEGVTATDLVLTIVEHLRKYGVVGKFVEFYGAGLNHLSLGDRATIANMAPEYGASCGIFPIDNETIAYLQLSGRSEEQIELVEKYTKMTGLWRDDEHPATYHENLSLDLSQIQPCLSGPKRPQDRIPLSQAKEKFIEDSKAFNDSKPKSIEVSIDGKSHQLDDGFVAIAAITSCTNTSNPSVMLAAGCVARNAHKRQLKVKPWVKTSLAPGSKVVTDYLQKSELLSSLQALGFYIVGYGCTTCIGNSGPLINEVSDAITKGNLCATSVLSGNRNFEGRIHSQVKMNYLASPPLVVAYALAGRVDIDFTNEPLGQDGDGNDVYLKDIWPTNDEIKQLIHQSLNSDQFHKTYKTIYQGTAEWQKLDSGQEALYHWPDSTYIARPPYFDDLDQNRDPDIKKAHVLAILGDSVTTDHISPAGAIAEDSPAGRYLQECGVKAGDFNSYGSRRGNHEVMMRGTFANIRLRNRLVPEIEGGYTRHIPSNKEMSIYDAAMEYKKENTPVIILAGKEYGSGSSRDWAAKGPMLQGVKAVIAESFERIHRSNLIGMGILPLQFIDGDTIDSLSLSGEETYTIGDVKVPQEKIQVNVTDSNAKNHSFDVIARIDTPRELEYLQAGGILRYVMRQLSK